MPWFHGSFALLFSRLFRGATGRISTPVAVWLQVWRRASIDWNCWRRGENSRDKVSGIAHETIGVCCCAERCWWYGRVGSRPSAGRCASTARSRAATIFPLPCQSSASPGLKPDYRWCLCACGGRKQSKPTKCHAWLRATHEVAPAHCSLADLKRFAVDLA